MAELIRYNDETFESIKHVNEFNQEYWLARELQRVLEYTEWRNFAGIIDKAKEACKNQGKTNHPNIPKRKKGKAGKTEIYKPNI